MVRPLAPWLVEATCAEEEEVVVLLLEDMIRLASRRIGCGCEKVVRRLVVRRGRVGSSKGIDWPAVRFGDGCERVLRRLV